MSKEKEKRDELIRMFQELDVLQQEAVFDEMDEQIAFLQKECERLRAECLENEIDLQ